MMPLLNRVMRYGLVGGTATAVHIKAVTRSIKVLITAASLKQAATTHTCSLAINARSALFEP